MELDRFSTLFCESPKGMFPCGKCRACRLKKANEKMIVSVFAAHEFKKKGQFLTLTYNDEYLPHGLNHADFAGFMKRLRKNTGMKGVKFYMAGEYGSQTHREHFHVLFYNCKFDIQDIIDAWIDVDTGEPLGFVYDGTLTPKAIKYVSGYVSKRGYEPDSGKRPPYGRSSCNIPTGLSLPEVVQICRDGYVKYNGRKFGVPTNWKRNFKDIWNYFHNFRIEQSYKNFDPDKIKWFTPRMVSAMMDDKERKYAEKRAHKRRIMYIMYSLMCKKLVCARNWI